MRTMWWIGALYELLTRLRRPLGWRAWQRLHVWWSNLRDVAVCLAAIGLWTVVVLLWA